MINASVNLIILSIFILLLIIEFVFSKILEFSYLVPSLITFSIYAIFIVFQIFVWISEDNEKSNIKSLLDEIMDKANGVPLINKDQKIIIKWDIIFKKLIDKKELALYNKILKSKTSKIDYYVNLYPSLLLDENTHLYESRNKNSYDLNSLVVSKNRKKDIEKKELVITDDSKNTIFIKEIESNRATFANYDASIYMDIILVEEKPEANDSNQCDGFSITLLYKHTKYILVPPIIVYGKVINKELWFYRNIENLLLQAKSILVDEEVHPLIVDELSLKPYLTDAMDSSQMISFNFQSLEDEMLVFKTKENCKSNIKAFCSFKTSYNSYELQLVKYQITKEDIVQLIESGKTIAIGNSYQPVITILEKMPLIIKNLELLFNNHDITEIVLK